MKKIVSAARSAVLAGLAGSLLSGQKIETAAPDANRIVHLVTALHHLTVIEVGEPVAMAAAGSNAFTDPACTGAPFLDQHTFEYFQEAQAFAEA